METWEVAVSGLDCADCAATLAKDIMKLKGVRSASWNFGTAKLRIEYDPSLWPVERIGREIEKLGYGIAPIKEFRRIVLFVEGLDCSEESIAVERQLKKLPAVKSWQFNLVSREVRVEYESSHLKPEQIIQAVQRTGMKARLKGQEHPGESFGGRRKHLILTILSSIFIVAAFSFSWAGFPHGITDPLYVLALVTGGYFTARKGAMALRTLSLDMNFLMTISVIGAALIEEWLEGAMVMFLFSVANILQNYSMDKARNAIRSLMKLVPNEVVVQRNGREERVFVADIQIGERIVVRPGEKIALDGLVVLGNSYVNQAPITGESLPVEKNPGDSVFAGTINQNGSLEVDVTHLYKDTTLARIIHMVEEAQAKKAPYQHFVEKFAAYYTPAVIGGAILVALVPPLILGLPFAIWFYRSLVLLVIACPCALVISTPVSIVSGLSAAARHGILIKGGAYLEEIGSLKAIAFDKTGTLTKGIPRVMDVISLNEQPEAKILGLAAAIEYRSEHPLAKAIIEEAARQGIEYSNAMEFQALPGKGAKARVEGQVFYIGNHRLCEELGRCSLEIDARLLDLEREGKTTVILASEDRALGIIAVADELRKESAPSIQRLKAGGIGKIVMITGDNKGTAGAIARSLGIDEYHAELMPEDKVAIIKDLRERFVKVGMVGDGVNDAPSMAVSSMGIAMGTIGTDTALETADVALMKDDLSKLPFALKLSKRTLRVIKQNIAFSLLLKGAFIALAIPGLATLWMAVGADMGASLLVIFNGLRLLATGEKGEMNG